MAGDVVQVKAFAEEMNLSMLERQQLDEALRTKPPSVGPTPPAPPAPSSPLPSPLSLAPPLAAEVVDLLGMPMDDHGDSGWQPDEELGAGDGWDFDDVQWPSENPELEHENAVAPPTTAVAAPQARSLLLPRAVTPPRRLESQQGRTTSGRSDPAYMRGGTV